MNGEEKSHVKGKASRNEIISKHIDFSLTSFYEFLILWMSQFLPKSAYFSIVDNSGWDYIPHNISEYRLLKRDITNSCFCLNKCICKLN